MRPHRAALAIFASLCCLVPSQLWAPPLAQRFEQPAQTDGVYAFWHWMGRHVSRGGITKDLEEMAAAGFAGVELFQLADVSTAGSASIDNNPLAAPELLSLGWWSLVGHAVAECDRLGMQLWLHNTLGWSAGGGPWVTEALARKKIVYAETRVPAGSTLVQAPRRPEPLKGTQGKTVCPRSLPAPTSPPPQQCHTRRFALGTNGQDPEGSRSGRARRIRWRRRGAVRVALLGRGAWA